jgi:hypothetical protein
MLSTLLGTVGVSFEMPNDMPGPTSRVDKTLPWVAVAWVIGATLITVLARVPTRLPAIAMSSTFVFLLERGFVVLALFVGATTIVSRGLKSELPRALSTLIGPLEYAQRVAEATTSSEDAAAHLKARLDEHDAVLARQEEKLDELTEGFTALAALVKSKQPPDPPAT